MRDGERSMRARAAGDVGLRVKAWILGDEGRARRAEITAPPCLSVAPVTRIIWGVDMLEGS